jgi:hypothetical protein
MSRFDVEFYSALQITNIYHSVKSKSFIKVRLTTNLSVFVFNEKEIPRVQSTFCPQAQAGPIH